MQITETLLAEQGDIRRFIQQAVDHLPRLLVIHFMLHSAEGSIAAQQIHAFYREFHRQVNTRVIQRSHTGGPSPSVVLRWLQEKHCGSTMRCVLLLSQDLFFNVLYSSRFNAGWKVVFRLCVQVHQISMLR